MKQRNFFSSLTDRTYLLISKCLFCILSVLFLMQQNNAFSQINLYGKWYQCSENSLDSKKCYVEYDFKNNSLVTLSYISEIDNDFCRYVSNLEIDGTYSQNNEYISINLDMSTLNVSILDYIMDDEDETFPEDSLTSLLESVSGILLKELEYIDFKFVRHENPNVMILKPVNDFSSSEVKLFRSQTKKEDLIVLKSNFQIFLEKHSDTIDFLIKFIVYIIVILIAYIFILILKFLFLRSISRAKSSEKNVMIRRIYSISRFILKIVIILIMGRMYILLFASSLHMNQWVSAVVLLGGGGLLLKVLSSISLPVNVITIKKFINKKRNFILYLRGFATDDYTPELSETADDIYQYRPWANIGVQEKKVNYNLLPLNEKELANACKKISPLYGVGLPEELESPEGAKRIYLDNDTWQDDALTLMKSARFIIVNIHPNTNCLWEIKQCNLHFSEKTIYFIDDIEKLKFVKDEMGEEIPHCLTSDEIKHNHMAVYCSNDKVLVESYVNTCQGIHNVILSFSRIINSR